MGALQIIYQPHVAHREGIWLTPDLALDTLTIAGPELEAVHVSVENWTTRVAVAESPAEVDVLPAIALVAASRGDLLAPAFVHLEAGRLQQQPAATLRAARIVVARAAWRLGEALETAALTQLTWSAGPRPAALTPLHCQTLASAADDHTILAELANGARLRKSAAVVLLLGPGEGIAPASSGWFSVGFEAPGLAPVSHEYARLPLPGTWEGFAS